MRIDDKINQLRRKAQNLTAEIQKCTETQAGITLRRELSMDRNKLFLEIGRLCSDKVVKICLQSDFIV